MKKYFSEFLGTAILVMFGCGTAAIAGNYVGSLGIAFAFGLGFLASWAIINKVSGCHINPAVSLAMFLSKKLSLKDLVGYVIAQILGALFGIFLVSFMITSANIGSIEKVGLGANGFKDYSSIGLSLGGALLTEAVLTMIFVLVVLRITANKDYENISGIVIGLTLILVHIIGVPLTGTSVNPARSLAPAIFLGKEALKQVWVFIVAPLAGAVIAALINKFILKK